MKRHDKGVFWAMREPEASGRVRIWNADSATIPDGYTLHVLVPMKDYDRLRMGWAEYRKSQRAKKEAK